MDSAKRLGVRLSAAVYRVLMVRYPRWLRDEHGSDMTGLFETLARELVTTRGLVVGLTTLWTRTARDLVRPVPPSLQVQEVDSSGAPRVFSQLREDTRFAVRSLARDPRFSALVTGILAVGIALNVLVFALINAYLLQPLPYPSSERVVAVRGGQNISWTEVDDLFEAAVSWDLDAFTILGDGRPHLALGAWITPDFLDVYGVRAHIGRTFLPDEAGESGNAVAMISYGLWRDRFGGDPSVVGSRFHAFTSDRPDDAESFVVVGVLPEDFWYLNDYTDVLVPIRTERELYAGRLRSDVPLERAELVLTEMARLRATASPETVSVELTRLHELHVASVRPTLLVLQGAVLLVLLIACANAAVLLLIRSARRRRELGVRRALGASELRLARQLVLEGLCIAAAAGASALLLAQGLLLASRDVLEVRLGRTVPGGSEALTLDGTVLLAAVGLCAMVGVGFGLAPLVAGRPFSAALSGTGRGTTDSKSLRRTRSVMVSAEVALSLALLVGAGLMMRSALALQHEDLGFTPDRIVRGEVGLRRASYPDPAERVEFFSTLIDRVTGLPGVESVGLASAALFTTRFGPRTVEAELGETVSSGEAVAWLAGEQYFPTLGIRLLRGRLISTADVAGAELVAVVSDRVARQLWGTTEAVGQRIRLATNRAPGEAPGDTEPWYRVVGVVADVKRALPASDVGDVYRSYRQADAAWLSLLVRRRPGAPPVLPSIEQAVADLDPEVPLASVRDLDEAVRDALAPSRFLAGLFSGFSTFALGLAVLGVYGVIAYAARQRQKDVAIRMALGADRRSVTRLFFREGLVVVGIGLGFGAAGGLAIGRALEAHLHGVTPTDPLTHISLAGCLALTALIAIWIPARRAALADPMRVLREE